MNPGDQWWALFFVLAGAVVLWLAWAAMFSDGKPGKFARAIEWGLLRDEDRAPRNIPFAVATGAVTAIALGGFQLQRWLDPLARYTEIPTTICAILALVGFPAVFVLAFIPEFGGDKWNTLRRADKRRVAVLEGTVGVQSDHNSLPHALAYDAADGISADGQILYLRPRMLKWLRAKDPQKKVSPGAKARRLGMTDDAGMLSEDVQQIMRPVWAPDRTLVASVIGPQMVPDELMTEYAILGSSATSIETSWDIGRTAIVSRITSNQIANQIMARLNLPGFRPDSGTVRTTWGDEASADRSPLVAGPPEDAFSHEYQLQLRRNRGEDDGPGAVQTSDEFTFPKRLPGTVLDSVAQGEDERAYIALADVVGDRPEEPFSRTVATGNWGIAALSHAHRVGERHLTINGAWMVVGDSVARLLPNSDGEMTDVEPIDAADAARQIYELIEGRDPKAPKPHFQPESEPEPESLSGGDNASGFEPESRTEPDTPAVGKPSRRKRSGDWRFRPPTSKKGTR